jgi:4-hydroxy-2-oxoglutarate aldolase
MKLHGIFVDTATPFDHAGGLYRVKIEHNIGKWNRTSVSGYVVGGFSGEGALLTTEEKAELWKVTAASASPDKLLIAGIDLPGVRPAIEQIDRAAAFGFAAALVETSHCGETQRLYFDAVADQAPIPVLISNRSGLSDDISQHPNIVGVVDHSGKLQLGGAPVLCGSETTLWDALNHGAAGAVLPFANAAPYAAIALWEAFRTREDAARLDWQSRIAPAAELINARYGVAGLKHAMDLNGYYGGPPRLPYTPVQPADRIEIERAFADLKS